MTGAGPARWGEPRRGESTGDSPGLIVGNGYIPYCATAFEPIPSDAMAFRVHSRKRRRWIWRTRSRLSFLMAPGRLAALLVALGQGVGSAWTPTASIVWRAPLAPRARGAARWPPAWPDSSRRSCPRPMPRRSAATARVVASAVATIAARAETTAPEAQADALADEADQAPVESLTDPEACPSRIPPMTEPTSMLPRQEASGFGSRRAPAH